MKRFTLLAFLCASTVLADVDITKEEASNMKGYELGELRQAGPTLDGKLVRIKFGYREANVTKTPEGRIKGTLLSGWWANYDKFGGSTATKKDGSVQVEVPADGENWFMKVTTDYRSRKMLVVIARMKTSDTGSVVAELLGREVRTDIKGSHVVW